MSRSAVRKRLVRAFVCAVLIVILMLSPFAAEGSHSPEAFSYNTAVPGIWLSRELQTELSPKHREELRQRLQQLTGWSQLHFNQRGRLLIQHADEFTGGSAVARTMLLRAQNAGICFLIEDHSNSPEVNFGQLDAGTIYTDQRSKGSLEIRRVRLDFADFREIQAPATVREAFAVSFTLMHELLHGLGYQDTVVPDEIGECETIVNRMRHELRLPLRDQYLGELLQVSPLLTSVRLRFSPHPEAEKRTMTWWSGRHLYLFFRPGERTCRKPVEAGRRKDALLSLRD